MIIGKDLTCVIPTHQRPALLADALASVSAQTDPPGEVVVVSDVADPATSACTEAANADTPFNIRFIDRSAERNPGASRSRNIGAGAATTRFVAFLDDDDRWAPTFVEEMTTALNTSGAPVAVCAMRRLDSPFDSRHDLIPVWEGASASEFIASRSFASGGNLIVDRLLTASFGPYDEDLEACNDLDCFYRLLEAGVQYCAVQRPLVEYRFHDAPQLSRRGAETAGHLRRLRRRHRRTMNLRARRRLSYEAAHIEYRTSTSRTTMAQSGARMIWNLPIEWLADRGTRSRLVRRVTVRLTSRGGRPETT